MYKKISLTIFGILIFFMACALFGCKEKEKAAEIIPVKVMEVKLQSIKNSLDYADDIKAQDEAIVYPKVTGKIIEKLKEDGVSVNKGDVIAYIDRDEVGFQFEKAPVESPLTGIIGRIYVDKGTSVTQQTPVALVVDMDKVKINLDIPEKYLPKISLGLTAEISLEAYPGETFIGTVSKISPVLDLGTRTAPIEIVIPNTDHRLKSGMFAKVQLIIEEHKDVPVIVKEAIIGKDPLAYVYTVKGNVACRTSIKPGIRQGAFYEIIEGLKEGDLVVVMGQQRLYDGAAVSVENTEDR